MAKDFAFLFYVNDWAGGTQWMTRLQRGAYIDLLLYQVNNTCFSLHDVKNILGQDFDHCWGVLEQKFCAENGTFYNKKMREVLDSRKKFTESRRENRLGKAKITSVKHKKNTSKSLVKQVGNENENEIVNKDVIIKEKVREKVFLTSDEILKAQEKLGSNYESAVDILENYKQSSGKKYKSDYHALIGWVKDKIEKEKSSGKKEKTAASYIDAVEKAKKYFENEQSC